MSQSANEIIDIIHSLNQEIENAISKNSIEDLSKASHACHHFIKNHLPINIDNNDSLKKQVITVLEQVLLTHHRAESLVSEHKILLESDLSKAKKRAVNINQYLNVSRDCY